jgi:ferredoxin
MKIITHTQLRNWLDEVAQEQTLVAPRSVSGVLLYRPVEVSDQISWEGARPALSAKEVFFPPTERLFLIEKKGDRVQLVDSFTPTPTVLFGVRPCDARGIEILDAMFLWKEPVDPYYQRRRQSTVLVGLACKEMGPACFCTSMGGGPNSSEGMDLLLSEVDGGYAVQVVTGRGEALLDGLAFAEFSGEYPTPVSSQSLPLVAREAWIEGFEDEFWDEVSERCLSCRICAYVCPTCRCFIVRDEALPGAGQSERIRCWDSCAGENYRRIAGGHKARPEKGERLRNRFLCKFVYYPQQYNLEQAAACTGCGRCVEACPVNIDITEVMQEFGRRT